MAPCSGANIRDMIRNDILSLESEITDVPYVGDYIGRKMRQRRIVTVGDFVRYVENKTPSQIYARFTVILQNQQGNQCVGNGIADPNYHVQDVNRCAYTKLRQVLIQVKRFWRRLGMVTPPRYPNNPIPRQMARTANAKRCGCYTSRRDCQADPGCESVRVDGEYVCIPGGNARGFKGVGTFAGQISRDNPRRGGYRYDLHRGKYFRRPSRTRRHKTLRQAT
jgi:hypothetical protein